MAKNVDSGVSDGDIPIFPPELSDTISSVKESRFINLDTTEFTSEIDAQHLVTALFRHPDIDYYFFENEGQKNPRVMTS
jgi:hypothetical protein